MKKTDLLCQFYVCNDPCPCELSTDSLPGHAYKYIKVDMVCGCGKNSKAYRIPHILGMTFICTCRLADWTNSESALKGNQSQYSGLKCLSSYFYSGLNLESVPLLKGILQLLGIIYGI